MAKSIYDFVFRGILAQEALEQSDLLISKHHGLLEGELAEHLNLDRFDDNHLSKGREMAIVFVSLYAFETYSRNFVNAVLKEKIGDKWYEGVAVSAAIRKRAEDLRREELSIKWHGKRGNEITNYIMLGDIPKIIKLNWVHFEELLRSQEWTQTIFSVIEKSRNVIMHSGYLEEADVRRIGIYMKDWIEQTSG